MIVNGLHFKNLRGDIFGGLTAAVVALPLAMAFGVASGAGPIAGLYGAIFVGLFAALFGGTPTQISGPTGPMTVVMALIFTHYTALDPINGAAMAFTVVMMGGLFQVLFGLLKVGKYINYVPQSVISGFMSGIGIIIILLQLAPLLGAAAVSDTLSAIRSLPAAVADINIAAFSLGLLTLAIVYFTPKSIGKWLPTPVLALVVSTLVLILFLPNSGVTVLGELPAGLPAIRWPVIEWGMLPDMIKSALTLALLGTIDSLLTSLVADNLTRTHHRSNRELIGQGIGNTVAGLLGGLPGAGATMRTVVNIRSGGETPLSGILHALLLVLIIIGLGSAAKYIPHVVLAGILIKVGTDIIDWRYLKRIGSTSKSGAVIMFTVLLMTVFVDLIMAVATGMAMACVLFLKRQSDRQLASLNVIRASTGTKMMVEEEAQLLNAAGDRLVVFEIGGPLSFGAAKDMVKHFDNETNYRSMVLDLQAVSALDYTASCAIQDVIEGAMSQGVVVSVVLPDECTTSSLMREGSLDAVERGQLFTDRLSALKAFS